MATHDEAPPRYFSLAANERSVRLDRVPVLAEHSWYAAVASDGLSTTNMPMPHVDSRGRLHPVAGHTPDSPAPRALIAALTQTLWHIHDATRTDQARAAHIAHELAGDRGPTVPILAFLENKADNGNGAAAAAGQPQHVGPELRTKQPTTGSAVTAQARRAAPSNDELERLALLTPGALRELNTFDENSLGIGGFFDWVALLGRAIGIMLGYYYIPRPPELINPYTLETAWFELPVVFPVYVNFPRFGVGLAMRYCCVDMTVSYERYNRRLYFAVQKFMPFGPLVPDPATALQQQRLGRKLPLHVEPFSRGIWAVPAHYLMRMRIAVKAVVLEENRVELVDNTGLEYSETWLDFRSNPDEAHEVARRSLMLAYPYDTTILFATRYDTSGHAPDDVDQGDNGQDYGDGEGDDYQEEEEEDDDEPPPSPAGGANIIATTGGR